MRRRFQQVDVFCSDPFSGNPLAVVHDADDLTVVQMQKLTRWLNLSETAFLMAPSTPEADYRVRIFTLARELPFAGHPTLGACQAWLSTGAEPGDHTEVIQDCLAGLVRVKRDETGLALAAPRLLRSGPVDPDLVEMLASVLGIDRSTVVDARWIDNGPGWVGVLLPDAATVLGLDPDFTRWAGPGSLDIGVVGPHPPGSDCAVEIRAFFSDERGAMVEDPVTGSLNASVAQWLLSTGRASAPYVASQGTRLGRTGRVRISTDTDGAVWVGGTATVAIDGTIDR